MKPILFHPEAANEANDAVDFYDERRAGLGESFRLDLSGVLKQIAGIPHWR
ncbi:hypothetical protein [Tuwongella immobilis]|uniref:Uncharacterized protein n=1 Tax=Tuwongella immobilis TaxID=692036 RepID=A0A6C2YVI0_9BACT|nr:hypothetical protein [Tuwongella immobilis]VIP05506.1 unnamed protein product [Tuwongella immobilis]VTS08368.1 unnamed protein product [Tuwongella immobilis]